MAAESCVRISGSPNMHSYTPTSATPAWKRGDIVKLDDAGTLIIATSGNNLGIAQADAPSTLLTECLVDVITPGGGEFLMVYNTTTATSILGEAGTITYTKGAHTVAAGSAADVVIVGLDARDTGTSGGHIIVTFRATGLQANEGF
jgi:hypothetical protein